MNGSEAKGYGQGGLISTFIIAAPAVVVYFLGWAYLNYYLEVFGIGIAELDISVETVLMYAAPAAIWLVKTPWLWLAIAGGVLLITALRLLCRRSPSCKGRLVKSNPSGPCMPWYAQIVVAFLVVFVGSALLAKYISPVVKEAAHNGATQAWDYSGIKILVTIASSESDPLMLQNFKTCARRKRLQLVFADKNGYYMLCPSEIDIDGSIFEVRRDGAMLASVRYVKKPDMRRTK